MVLMIHRILLSKTIAAVSRLVIRTVSRSLARLLQLRLQPVPHPHLLKLYREYNIYIEAFYYFNFFKK
jgi:hypothetical protein